MAFEHSQVIIVQLDGTSRAYRSHRMQNFLKGENLWNHIPDKAEVPTEMDPKYEE